MDHLPKSYEQGLCCDSMECCSILQQVQVASCGDWRQSTWYP